MENISRPASAKHEKILGKVRERLVALEVNVSHLPSKGVIVGVVTAALTIIAALLTIAPQLQRLAGTSTVSTNQSSR
jgi:hypothetical protein